MSTKNSPNSGRSHPFMYRILGMGLVSYFLIDLIVSFFKGGEDAPSLLLIVLAIAMLGGGIAFVAVLTWKEWKLIKQREEYENITANADYYGELDLEPEDE